MRSRNTKQPPVTAPIVQIKALQRRFRKLNTEEEEEREEEEEESVLASKMSFSIGGAADC